MFIRSLLSGAFLLTLVGTFAQTTPAQAQQINTSSIIASASWNRDNQLAIGYDSGVVRVTDASSGAVLYEITEFSQVLDVAWHPFMSNVPTIYEQESDVYVVVQKNQPTTIEILLVPAESQVEVITQSISVPELWMLTDAYGSPAASNIALVFRNGVNSVITNYDVLSKSLTTIADNVPLPPPGLTLMAQNQDVAFSPDGSYLSYNIGEQSLGIQPGTMVYDFARADLWQLNTGQGRTSQLAWTPDSEQVALVVTECQPDCSASLQIHSVSTRQMTQKIEISETIPESATHENTGVCQLAWSPNSRYLSFMATCGRSNYGYNKEIYVVEAQTGSITRVTDFTYTQERIEPLYAVLGEYVIAWLSADELIISASYGSGEGTRTTFIYNVTSQQSTPLSNGFFTDIEIDPVTGRVLLQPSLNDDYQVQSPIDAIAVMTQSEQITIIESENATRPVVGCNPDFSPDGQTFILFIPKSENCLDRMAELQIWSAGKTTALARRFSFPTDPAVAFAIPVGWVRKPAIN